MNKIKKITINFPYITQEAFIGHDLKLFICEKIKKCQYDRILLVIDRNVYKIHKSYIDYIASKTGINSTLYLKPEANYKSYPECDRIFERLVRLKASRKSCIIAVGGGYVSDIAGYAASVYMRGIEFIQISTTVMSMVDPVIGKVAINYKGIKNLLGSFYSPRYVFCDTDFIKTINLTEKIYGLVEAWKHVILISNREYTKKIESYLTRPEDKLLIDLIPLSIETKKYFVERDDHDVNGHHKALSLGHTMANYFEKNPAVRHGVAVFYGMMLSFILAYNIKIIDRNKYQSLMHTATLFEKKIQLLPEFKKEMIFKQIIKSLSIDKINNNGQYNFVLPTQKNFVVKNILSRNSISIAINDFNKLFFK